MALGGMMTIGTKSCEPLCWPQMHGMRVEPQIGGAFGDLLYGEQTVSEELASGRVGVQGGVVES
jgi:hypothetical protein